jgi:hypothetical protein
MPVPSSLQVTIFNLERHYNNLANFCGVGYIAAALPHSTQ